MSFRRDNVIRRAPPKGAPVLLLAASNRKLHSTMLASIVKENRPRNVIEIHALNNYCIAVSKKILS